MKTLPRYTGGTRALWGGLGVGGLGLLLTGLGFIVAPAPTLWSWLFAFTHWFGLAVAALLMLVTFHTTRARWAVVFRRIIEAMALSVVVLIPAFIPLAVGMETLYPWNTPSSGLAAEDLYKLHHKAPYLNVPFFVARAVLYFAVWAAVAWLLDRWSRRQDTSDDPRLGERLRLLSGPGIPVVALCFSFATLDWVMSIEPLWGSTIYALYLFSGSFVSVLALVTIVAARGQKTALFSELLRPSHFQALGNLMLGMCAFWAYMAFSQFMLIWIGNLPDEVTWYRKRTGEWAGVAVFIPIAQFVIPFFLLLFKELKRSPQRLQWVAGWLLLAHAVDVYWLVIPAAFPSGPHLHWTLFTAFAGLGGACVAFVAWRLRGGYAVPIGDPQLPQSLHYGA